MAKHLDIKSVDLLTNNPRKIKALETMGLIVNKRIPLLSSSNEHNEKYLTTKAKKLGHLM